MRILKKVEETRARAAKMKTIKEENEQNFLEKMYRKDEKESELRQKQVENAQEKAAAA